jgi:hypothetical protein
VIVTPPPSKVCLSYLWGRRWQCPTHSRRRISRTPSTGRNPNRFPGRRRATTPPGIVQRVAAISAQAKPLPFSAITLQALKLTTPLAC